MTTVYLAFPCVPSLSSLVQPVNPSTSLQNPFTPLNFSACLPAGPMSPDQPGVHRYPKHEFHAHHIGLLLTSLCHHTHRAHSHFGVFPLGASNTRNPQRWFYVLMEKTGPSRLFCRVPRILWEYIYLPLPWGVVNKIIQINSQPLLAPKRFDQPLPPTRYSGSKRKQNVRHFVQLTHSWLLGKPTPHVKDWLYNQHY